MNKCKDCRYWATIEYHGKPPITVCEKIDWAIGKEGIREMEFCHHITVADNTGLDFYLVTGPEFGCALFYAKESEGESLQKSV